MKVKSIFWTLLIATVSYAMPKGDKKPNIIFFLVDDLGYMDLGCYGSKFYETPNIDQLSKEGVRFVNGYESAPRCVESRRAIMSGLYCFRSELNNSLGAEQVTIAEALKEQGYGTFFIGKWHLSHNENEMPQAQGFDVNIAGDDHGHTPTYWYPYGKPEAKGEEAKLSGLEGGKEGEYLTDRITDETIKYIRNQVKANPNQPFFTMVSHYGVHTPLEGKPEYVEKYKAKAAKIKYDGAPFIQELTGTTKMHQDNPVYAAMVQSIDDSMGKLRATLNELGIADNTIIVFTSDNGGLSTTKLGSNREVATSNKPLKTGKGWLYEGGIRLPFVVYDPVHTKAPKVEETPVVGTDIYPTLLQMVGAPLKPMQHKDGFSFLPLIKGESYKRPLPIVWDYDFAKVGTGNPSMAAVRDGDYKLVELKHTNTYELYNLKTDIGEQNDISAKNPEIVKRLKNVLFDYRDKVGKSHQVTNKGFIKQNEQLYLNMQQYSK